MRVQFTVTGDEWKKLEEYANEQGYPDVPSYCRDICLNERTYAELWKIIVDKISKMEKGKQFALRDLIDVPPTNLGRKLYANRERLGIEFHSKDSWKADTYVKL